MTRRLLLTGSTGTAPVEVSPTLTVTANLDGTYAITGDGVTANLDGTFSITGPNVAANLDGTYQIGA